MEAKQAVRELAWDRLAAAGAARFPGARGRIPNFTGAEAAAALLAAQPEWQAARVVKVNPDLPQLPVRARALAEGRRLYMAVPRLARDRPFVLLDPEHLDEPPRRAASIAGGMRLGRPVAIAEMEPLDLVVCGSVAVNRLGVRVGKGGGFSDLELRDRPRLPRRPGRHARRGDSHGGRPPPARHPLVRPGRGQDRRGPGARPAARMTVRRAAEAPAAAGRREALGVAPLE